MYVGKLILQDLPLTPATQKHEFDAWANRVRGLLRTSVRETEDLSDLYASDAAPRHAPRFVVDGNGQGNAASRDQT
jgi:hypothetical protein